MLLLNYNYNFLNIIIFLVKIISAYLIIFIKLEKQITYNL